ncbi:MAG: hypothetical protein V4675_02090 [Verrucomicrobiota bacterium]
MPPIGHPGGVHLKNRSDIAAYCDAIERGEHAVFRAYATDPQERLILEFILQLKLGSASPTHYQQKFGVKVLEKFAPQLASLQQESFATITADEITIHRAGLLQIDRLLHGFFLHHHRHARYT